MKFVDINYERYRNIFENSDKFSNQKNLKLHKCSEKTPDEFGVYVAYEQYDLDDQYLVIWTGEKWVDFEHGSDICFGSKTREDHWSELPSNNEENPCSKIKLPRYIRTISNIVNQLQDTINTIVYNFPTIYYRFDRKEIISENTELKFREFLSSLNEDIHKSKENSK